jgi:glycerol-3-phosphate dehydrogenase
VQQAGSNATKDLIRDHEIEVDVSSGLISVLGGKWTTYRLMAKDAVDEAGKQLGVQQPCITATIKLLGSQHYNEALLLQQEDVFPASVVKHLVRTYGDQSVKILQLAKEQAELAIAITPNLPYTYAELQYIVSQEMAYTIEDVISRRWGVDLQHWEDAILLATPVGNWMAKHLHWSAQQQARYTSEYIQKIQFLIYQSTH